MSAPLSSLQLREAFLQAEIARTEVAWREWAVSRREAEVARREAVVAQREAAVFRREESITAALAADAAVENENAPEEDVTSVSLDGMAADTLAKIAEALMHAEQSCGGYVGAILPRHLGRLSRTCRELNAALKDTLAKLWEEHRTAEVLFRKCTGDGEHYTGAQFLCSNQGLTAVDMPAFVILLRSKALSSIQSLYLNHNYVGNEIAAALAAAAAGGGLSQLTSLHFAACRVGDAGMQTLANAIADGDFRKLVRLDLDHNYIGDAGIAALAEALKGAPKLAWLMLNNNQIGDRGVKALMAAAGAGGLAKLEDLGLAKLEDPAVTRNPFGVAAVEALADTISTGKLPSFNVLFISSEHSENQRLKAAGNNRGVHIECDTIKVMMIGHMGNLPLGFRECCAAEKFEKFESSLRRRRRR